MFAKAYDIARTFIRPLVTCIRYYDNSVEAGCCPFIIVNKDGWIITAAHLYQPFITFQQHQTEITEYNKQKQIIEQNSSINAKQKKHMINKLKTNPKWITDVSFWWGQNGVVLDNIQYHPAHDILIGKLNPYVEAPDTIYPTFKDPKKLDCGTSLCKIGYPFNNTQATYDRATKAFTFNQSIFTLFPLEGIFTRTCLAGKTTDGEDIQFIETSSPGLRGQSGGPTIDVNGTIWGIQSKTMHLPLGFDTKMTISGKEIRDEQYLHVGLGVHPSTIISAFKKFGINFKLSNY